MESDYDEICLKFILNYKSTNPNVWGSFNVLCIQIFLLINKPYSTYPSFLITSTNAQEIRRKQGTLR
jgi:hypothetical protein